MPDYPINKLSNVAGHFFKSNTKDRFNYLMNRLYDIQEIVLETRENIFDGVVLEGIEANVINFPTPPIVAAVAGAASAASTQTTTQNSNTPTIAIDSETGKEYVILSVRCYGFFSPTNSLLDPLQLMATDINSAIFWKEIHPKARMPIALFLKSPITFRSKVKIQYINGIYEIIETTPDIVEIMQNPGLLSGQLGFADPNFLFGQGGGISPQDGIIINPLPQNQKKVPGTIFPKGGTVVITSLLGWRGRPATAAAQQSGTAGQPSFHTGIDIGIGMRETIFAVADGVVTNAKLASSLTEGCGWFLTIDHKNLKRVDGSPFPCSTKYCHSSQLLVTKGQEVKRGQPVALGGSTGNSTGPHIHFEVNKDGKYWDPLWLFDWYANGADLRHKDKYPPRAQNAYQNGGFLQKELVTI